MSEHEETDTSATDADALFDAVFETTNEGLIIFGFDGNISSVNTAFESFVDQPRDVLRGKSVAKLAETDPFTETAVERIRETLAELKEGAKREHRLRFDAADGRDIQVRLRVVGPNDGDGDAGIVGIVRTVAPSQRDLDELERKQTALRRLYEIQSTRNISEQDRILQVLDVGREYLGLPLGFLTDIDGKTQKIVRVLGDHPELEAGATAPLSEAYCRKTVDSDDLVEMEDAIEVLGTDDPAYQRFGLRCYIGTKVMVGKDLYGTFCFGASDARERSFSRAEQDFVKLLGQWVGYALERDQFETRLKELTEVAGDLVLAETKEDVARVAVETSSELFELPVTACWEYDPAADALRPLAETETCLEVVGKTPTFQRGTGLVWECFENDELRTYEDLSAETETYNRESLLRSEVHVPLGNQGVIISGATEPRGFAEVDIESLRLLGEIVEVGMVSVTRRTEILERGETLQRQNEQLEEFSRVVAHDLRNPLSGAFGFLEIARETGDSSHFDRVESSLNRMEDLIDELLDIARGERQRSVERDLHVNALVEEAWSYLEADTATLTIAGDLGQIHADETRLLQLLGNLFRNSVEHVGDNVTITVGRLADGRGFYVEDDGQGVSETARSEVLKYGKTGSETGTGIGLMSVVDVVESHGWDLEITDADGGGARFEIRTR